MTIEPPTSVLNDGSADSWIRFREEMPALRDELDRHLTSIVVAPKQGGHTSTLASGILVRRDGRTGILTAAHVASDVRKCLSGVSEYFPFVVASTKKSSKQNVDGEAIQIELKLKRSRLIIVGGNECGMLKPDIAWIPLPVDISDRIEAESAQRFYDWRCLNPPRNGAYCHFVSGCIGAHSRKLRDRLNIRAVLPEFRQVKCDDFFTPEWRGEWDFLTVTVYDSANLDTEERFQPKGVPESVWNTLEVHPGHFGGVSGAPLWCVHQAEEGEPGLRKLKPELWGMAFAQVGSPSLGRAYLSCHGPGSIERITSSDGGTIQRV